MGASVQTGHQRRRRALLAAGAVALGAVVAACGPPDPPPPGCPTTPPDAVSSTVLNRVNADRGANGLGGLSWNARLACLAQEWSGVMAGRGALVHRDLGATIRSPGFESYARLGENIFVGPGGVDGNAMHNAWMASPPHRANILGDYDAIGVGWPRAGRGGPAGLGRSAATSPRPAERADQPRARIGPSALSDARGERRDRRACAPSW